jgi:hypothetical protein
MRTTSRRISSSTPCRPERLFGYVHFRTISCRCHPQDRVWCHDGGDLTQHLPSPVEGSVLDVGGGIGALSFELLDQGAARAMIVDASGAYLDAAAEESKRRDRVGVMQMVPGDFVTLAERVPPAAIVTLDRVVCCYPDYEALIRHAAELAEKRFAYSYPRDRWFVQTGSVGRECA